MLRREIWVYSLTGKIGFMAMGVTGALAVLFASGLVTILSKQGSFQKIHK